MSYGYQQQYTPAYAYPETYPARRSAPASVQVVALLHYLAGLAVLAVAAVAALVGTGRLTVEYPRVVGYPELSELWVGRGLLVAAGVLGLIGLIVLVIARKLQRGRQWARVLVLMFSLLSLASTAYALYLGYRGYPGVADRDLLAGAVIPVLYLILLNTRAARAWFRGY